MNKKLTYLFFILLFFTQCEDDMSEIEKKRDSDINKINNYLIKNNIPAKEVNEIFYLSLKENVQGEKIEKGDIIYAKCEISILDGDSLKMDTDTIIAFEHGSGSLIPEGLDIGCRLMRKGERFRFFLPSPKAFYWYSNSDIKLKPYSILVCDIEIVDIQSKDERFSIEKDSITNYIAIEEIEQIKGYADGLYFKKLTEKGKGSCPNNGDIVRINFERKYLDGRIHFSTFNNNPVTFRLGTGKAVKGLEEGIKLLKPGESALLIMPSRIAFGGSTQVIPHELRNEIILDEIINNTPEPFSPLVYRVELLK